MWQSYRNINAIFYLSQSNEKKNVLISQPAATAPLPLTTLVHLDSTVDLTHEPQTGEEADGASEHEEGDADHGHVGEVQHGGYEALDAELGAVVPDGVQEEIQAGRACGQEGAPPPLVIFIAQLQKQGK